MPPYPEYILGVIGVRDLRGSLYTNHDFIYDKMNSYIHRESIDPQYLQIVIGGGRGVEDIVMQWADRGKVPYRKVPPNIQDLGPKKAFVVRNKQIVFQSQALLVFWDGCNDTITDALTTAAHAGRPVSIIPLQ